MYAWIIENTFHGFLAWTKFWKFEQVLCACSMCWILCFHDDNSWFRRCLVFVLDLISLQCLMIESFPWHLYQSLGIVLLRLNGECDLMEFDQFIGNRGDSMQVNKLLRHLLVPLASPKKLQIPSQIPDSRFPDSNQILKKADFWD